MFKKLLCCGFAFSLCLVFANGALAQKKANKKWAEKQLVWLMSTVNKTCGTKITISYANSTDWTKRTDASKYVTFCKQVFNPIKQLCFKDYKKEVKAKIKSIVCKPGAKKHMPHFGKKTVWAYDHTSKAGNAAAAGTIFNKALIKYLDN